MNGGWGAAEWLWCKQLVIYLVLDTFSSRQVLLHQAENESSSVCNSPTEFVVSMITVSSECLMHVIPGAVLLHSLVYRLKKKWRDDRPLRSAGGYCPSRAEVTIHPDPLVWGLASIRSCLRPIRCGCIVLNAPAKSTKIRLT